MRSCSQTGLCVGFRKRSVWWRVCQTRTGGRQRGRFPPSHGRVCLARPLNRAQRAGRRRCGRTCPTPSQHVYHQSDDVSNFNCQNPERRKYLDFFQTQTKVLLCHVILSRTVTRGLTWRLQCACKWRSEWERGRCNQSQCPPQFSWWSPDWVLTPSWRNIQWRRLPNQLGPCLWYKKQGDALRLLCRENSGVLG